MFCHAVIIYYYVAIEQRNYIYCIYLKTTERWFRPSEWYDCCRIPGEWVSEGVSERGSEWGVWVQNWIQLSSSPALGTTWNSTRQLTSLIGLVDCGSLVTCRSPLVTVMEKQNDREYWGKLILRACTNTPRIFKTVTTCNLIFSWMRVGNCDKKKTRAGVWNIFLWFPPTFNGALSFWVYGPSYLV